MREAVLSVGEADLAELGIDDLLAVTRDAGLRDVEELVCRGASSVVRVEVESALDEQRLADIEYVEECEHIPSAGDTEQYVVAFETPAFGDDASEHAADLVGTCDPEFGEDGATLSLVGPQRAIRGTVGEYEAAGASLDLERLGAYDGADDPMDGLTDRQREVLTTAFDAGYYEVPREASTSDVAAELGVDDSTVAEHLQRAERNLLAHHLAD
ncbi:MAG: helix-turn-helix domain-containing protein [Halobacterium sp.]